MTVEGGAATASDAEHSHPSRPDRIVQPAIVDPRPRWRRLLAPAAVAAAVVVGCGYVYAFDPNQSGQPYLPCPTQAIFGVDCPGCGATRGMYALLHADLPRMMDHNVLLLAFVPVAIVFFARWVRHAWSGIRPAVTSGQARRQSRTAVVVLLLVIAFGVIRNFVPYLGSGA